MDENDHIFQSGGDSCGICSLLDGQLVPAGYQAHDNCMCQTFPKGDDDGCTWHFSWVGNDRYGNGDFDVISGIEVTVICSDGSELGQSGQFNGGSSTDLDAWEEGLEGAAEEIASELCSQCPKPEPFLCC